jgi:hypothetical protein
VTPESGPTFHLREICPKDFYYAQILRQRKESYFPLALRLFLNPDEVLDLTTISQTRVVLKWVSETLLDQNVFAVENWLEVSYHLCKQRWDSSHDWLETQPMSKVHAMIEVVKNHAEQQEKAMKSSRR